MNHVTPGDAYQKVVHSSRNSYVWFFIATVILLVGLLFGARIFVDYKRTISRTEERLLTQTRVIDENLTTNLTLVNLMLDNIVKELDGTSGFNQLNSYLRHQLAMTPCIRTLKINDRQGRCVYSNRDELLGKDLSDRDDFRIPRDASDKGMLFLSPPYTTIEGTYVISIAKSLTGKRGEFNGVVSITLDPEYFSKVLTSTLYAPDNRVTLIHSDATVFIAVPEARIAIAGQKLTQPGSAFLQHRGAGTPTSLQRGIGKSLGDKRIFAVLTNSPKGVRFDNHLVVAASRTMDGVLARWRMDAGVEVLIYLLFVALSLVSFHPET